MNMRNMVMLRVWRWLSSTHGIFILWPNSVCIVETNYIEHVLIWIWSRFGFHRKMCDAYANDNQHPRWKRSAIYTMILVLLHICKCSELINMSCRRRFVLIFLLLEPHSWPFRIFAVYGFFLQAGVKWKMRQGMKPLYSNLFSRHSTYSVSSSLVILHAMCM